MQHRGSCWHAHRRRRRVAGGFAVAVRWGLPATPPRTAVHADGHRGCDRPQLQAGLNSAQTPRPVSSVPRYSAQCSHAWAVGRAAEGQPVRTGAWPSVAAPYCRDRRSSARHLTWRACRPALSRLSRLHRGGTRFGILDEHLKSDLISGGLIWGSDLHDFMLLLTLTRNHWGSHLFRR